jgi:hypothetical protein
LDGAHGSTDLRRQTLASWHIVRTTTAKTESLLQPN